MTTVDLGKALANDATCPRCHLGGRPVWLDGDQVATCATCAIKAHLGVLVMFRAEVRADAGRISTRRGRVQGEAR